MKWYCLTNCKAAGVWCLKGAVSSRYLDPLFGMVQDTKIRGGAPDGFKNFQKLQWFYINNLHFDTVNEKKMSRKIVNQSYFGKLFSM